MADERAKQSSASAQNSPPADERQAEGRQAERREDDRDAARPFEARRLAETSDERYTREVWKDYARTRFGVSPHAIAGALAHHDPAEEISRAAVQEALDSFSTRRGV